MTVFPSPGFSRRRLCGAALAACLTSRVRAARSEPEVFDIVVAGSGAAGLTAAVMANEERPLRVLVLEKTPFLGGTSALCEGQWSVSETSFQKAQGIADSDELFYDDLLRAGDGENDPALVRTFIREGRLQFEWCVAHGLTPHSVSLNSGLSVPRAHAFSPALVLERLRKEAPARGVEIRTSSPVTKLLYEKNRVTGVVTLVCGEEKTIFARRGVILATGGFGRNTTLLRAYAPQLLRIPSLTAEGNTGDAILMTRALDVRLRDMEELEAGYAFLPHPDSIADMTHVFYGGAVIVNKRGERFVDESLAYNRIAQSVLAQPDATSYLLFDEAVRRRQIETRAVDRALYGSIDRGVVPHYVVAKETWTDVAREAGLPAETLLSTLRRYNDEVRASGRESQFGRSSLDCGAGKVVPLDEPPFYCVRVVPALLGTYCGIAIDTSARVLRNDGSVVAGLYAAGECTGGLHGRHSVGGSHYGAAFAFGRVAGLAAARGSTST